MRTTTEQRLEGMLHGHQMWQQSDIIQSFTEIIHGGFGPGHKKKHGQCRTQLTVIHVLQLLLCTLQSFVSIVDQTEQLD